MTKAKKIILGVAVALAGYCVWCQTYSYNIDRAAEHVTRHAYAHSHHCCAWFVMRAMQSGGCPIGILPAWAYRYALPFYGFKQIAKGRGNDVGAYTPKKGDIVVINCTSDHIFGHIAMYNGSIWVSDFTQKNMSPYGRKKIRCRIYRKK